MSTAVEETPQPQVTTEPIPGSVKKKLERGRNALKKTATKRRMWYRYWRGETYAEINARGQLINLPTLSTSLGGGRIPQRIRNKYPFISMIVQAKVSAATQRVPSYEVIPSKVDPNSQQAAELAEKVALYGYDKWRLRRKTIQAVEHALVGGEAFAYPYWDDSVGPFVTVSDETGQITELAQGEVGVLILSANEVVWEPGSDFEECRWYAIERAVPIDVVKEMPGYLGGELQPNATESEAPKDTSPDHLVLVTEYFHRPTAKDPEGVRMTMANNRRILEDGPYPCQDHQGNVVDEPVLLRLSYIVESDDRDRGLVEQLIDLQRTIQDCWNKILEYKNRGLNLQMTAPRGSNMSRRTDEPGAVWYYNAISGLKPDWEPPPSPQFLSNLVVILEKAIEHMRALAADVDVQPDPRLTSETAQQAVEQAQLRWQSFLGDLAEFHSRLMRRCLYLVQSHYTEARDIKIQGTFGPDLEEAFRGADLLGQADIRVSPDSLASKSRQSVINETLLFADRGWITPQAAMATIQGGVAENLWKGWANDVGRAQFLIQTIKPGEGAVMNLPLRPVYPGEPPPVDPTGQPLYPGPTGEPQVPSWMPRPFDKAATQREVFEWWMKTTDWDRLDPAMQHVAILIYQALVDLDNKQQAEAQQAMVNQAQSLGMGNAAKPQSSQMPSQRNAGSAPAPFNQENQNG